MNGRWPTEKIYVPESQSIVETIQNLQKKGKMKLTFKGQTDAEALSKKINEKGPVSTAANLRPGDEFDGSVVPLAVNDIHPYDRNPRTSPNPKYEEIKASIRERKGLKGQLTVTKRPGDHRYMLYMGGNTRLQIVKELFAETGERCFGEVNCVFHQWKSEADVLASHLIENEARGDTLFIEKARGLIDLICELELETGKRLSSRSVQATTASMGMTVNHSTVLLYEFAVKHLQPLGPWLTRENTNTIKQRYAQFETVAKALSKMGEFLDQYPARTLEYQKVFAETLIARQVALRDEENQTTIISLRGDTLNELLRGFDGIVADLLALDPVAARRVFAALDATGKESVTAETLRTLISGDDSPSIPPMASAPNPAKSAPKRTLAATEKTEDAMTPSVGAPPDRVGSMPPQSVTEDAHPTPGDRTLVSEQGKDTFGADSVELPKPAPLGWQEVLTEQRYTEIGLFFFSKLKEWCGLTRIEQWLNDGTQLHLPYHFWLELPDEIADRGERDVRLENIRDPDYGLLDADMLKARSSSFRLIAMLSGQLGGVIKDENGGWTTEMAFAERLPVDSPWRQAALVDYMTTDAFYNVWESQLGGVTTQHSCQCALAPHDLLIALHGPFAQSWAELTAAYLDWGRTLTYWHAQHKSMPIKA